MTEAVNTHVAVLPGGGYAEHAPHDAEPVTGWLAGIRVQASVFRCPLNVRRPVPLDALRGEIRRRRADRAQHIGPMGFSASRHLAGLAARAPGATPEQAPQLRRSTSLDALVTPQSPPFFVGQTAEAEGMHEQAGVKGLDRRTVPSA
jgi:hypothetical protein